VNTSAGTSVLAEIDSMHSAAYTRGFILFQIEFLYQIYHSPVSGILDLATKD